MGLFALGVAGRTARTAACREVGDSLMDAGFGAGVSLAAPANDPFMRERGFAIASGSSRRVGRVAKVGEPAASSAPGAFGAALARRRRFGWRAPGLSSSQRVTPNTALQRTATLAFSYRCAAVTLTGSVTAYALAMNPSIRRACASRRCAHTRAPRSRSLSLGSLGDLHAVNRVLFAFLLFCLAPFGVAADPAIDALLKASPLIVVAEPVFQTASGYKIPPLAEASEVVLVKYSIKFRIKRVLKSETEIKPDDTILTRLALYFDDTFKPQEGTEVILFLRKTSYEENSFENTSIWFGVMSHSKLREMSLGFAIKEALGPNR